MLTPQQLMDMPGAGDAQKQLRKEGRWKLTRDERISASLDSLMNAVDDAHDAVYEFDKEFNK